MKNYILFFTFFSSLALFSQKDSLQIGDPYYEDQLYFNVSYNQLFNQPDLVSSSGFSYGISAGYIRDISLLNSGKFALGIGLGYAFDSFNHGLDIVNVNNTVAFNVSANSSSNNLLVHSLELPFEIRWRTSTANKYKFWRIYTGIKFSYNLQNKFYFDSGTTTGSYSNVNRFEKFQYGLTLATGYAAFNLYVYYGLTPMLKDATVGTKHINSKILKMGLIFYIL